MCSVSYPDEKRMRHIISSSVACSILYHLVKRHDIREKCSEHTQLFRFSVKLLSETFLIIRRNERDIMTNVYKCRSSRKVPIIFARF